MNTPVIETIIIRQAVENDFTAIDAIERASAACFRSSLAISGELTNEYTMNLAAIAFSGALRGYLLSTIVADEMSIRYVFTHPLYRRRRIGLRLIETAIAQARKRGACNAYLEVRSKNIAARGLYAALGFVRQAVRKKYYADDGDDALVMAKRL